MTHYESRNDLVNDIDEALDTLLSVTEELQSLRDSKGIDEDYKLAWNQNLTKEFFAELKRLAREVSGHCNQESAPF